MGEIILKSCKFVINFHLFPLSIRNIYTMIHIQYCLTAQRQKVYNFFLIEPMVLYTTGRYSIDDLRILLISINCIAKAYFAVIDINFFRFLTKV